jgi:dihydroxy-acid dehydratase
MSPQSGSALLCNGGLAILFGNLARTERSSKPPHAARMREHEDHTRFRFRREVTKALMAKSIKSGDVVVIRYEGPKAAPASASAHAYVAPRGPRPG